MGRQFSNTVFILGAGASRGGGAPLMADFLDMAHDLWKLDRVKDASDAFEIVFRAIGELQSVHSKSHLDIQNVESVFAAFEMGELLKTFPNTDPSRINELADSMRTVIVRTLEETLAFEQLQSTVLPPHGYKSFGHLISSLTTQMDPKHSVTIITFNYDLACELALYMIGSDIDYALVANKNPNAVPLLKLHGSLNWVNPKVS